MEPNMAMRRSIDTMQARDFMRKYRPQVVRAHGAEFRITKPSNCTLKRMLCDPEVPKEVKQHVYAWRQVRKHRGRAN